MEADLARYYSVDLRDHWRRDERGRRLLTLRQIGVRVRHLPPGSAVAQAHGDPGLVVGDYLLLDVYAAIAQQPHPSDPRGKKGREISAEDIERHRSRSRARRERLGITGSVLRRRQAA